MTDEVLEWVDTERTAMEKPRRMVERERYIAIAYMALMAFLLGLLVGILGYTGYVAYTAPERVDTAGMEEK